VVTAIAAMLVAPAGHLSGHLPSHSDLDNKDEGHVPFRFRDVNSVGNSEQSNGVDSALYTNICYYASTLTILTLGQSNKIRGMWI